MSKSSFSAKATKAAARHPKGWRFRSLSEKESRAGGYVKKDGTENGINATSRFPMYSVMKFPQALYVADFLTRNNIELNTEVIVWKDDLMQDTWSPMLTDFFIIFCPVSFSFGIVS